MMGSVFKTPLPRKRLNDGASSDSDESVASGSSDNGTQSSNGDISLVAEFDDLMRVYHQERADKLEITIFCLDFVEQLKMQYTKYFEALNECRRLQDALEVKTSFCTDLDHKLNKARKFIDVEKSNTRKAERERDELTEQINHVRNILLKDKGTSSRLSDDVRHKLSFLDNYVSSNAYSNGLQPQLSAIKEINSTGSMLSDFSYSRSEEDLDSSILQAGKQWKKHRPSSEVVLEPAMKKRRSSEHKTVEINNTDTVRATTTLTVPKDGPITATSVIESLPKTPRAATAPPKNEGNPSSVPANLVFESWARESPRRCDGILITRQHCFQQKTVVIPETCVLCEKRIRFGKTAMKCKECKGICHVECKDNLPLPCVPAVNTPNHRNFLGVIGDYTPTTRPMVPPILIHCIKEIELRGLEEVGLYRVPGAEFGVKALKEKFLKGRSVPCLNHVDIHVICGVVKDFLRSLHEPLVTYSLRSRFVEAVERHNMGEIVESLCRTVGELPQPNRETLAYVILHLQRIADAKECKMNVSNLAKVIGPTIVGYTSDDPSPNNLLQEMVEHNKVMEHLINLPFEYWSSLISVDEIVQQSRLQATPSTDSLLHPAAKGLLTPRRNLLKRKQKYFPSPKQ